MAVLNTQYYSGLDRYSDGDAEENAVLEAVRAGKRLREMDTEEVSWPMLYHLSPVRENICNWYLFRRGARILEIGAGCGAVTGALCRNGAEVFSVDLSLRRSTINYERHKDAEGLHILVGNLNEIPFTEPFDYVLLIGVLEYAGRFTEGEQPYRTFLENCRKWLKPDGKILVAIENRLGIKYFAGMEEDHLGRTYAGLRDYEPFEGVRTFSRGELRALLQQAGFPCTRFYYPYPDYKFPLEIFTDETLQSQHYGKPFQVFDKDQTVVFMPEKVMPALTEDGGAGILANSFLAEAGFTEDAAEEKILYVKQNNGRREDFRTGTVILERQGKKVVEKVPLTPGAEEHLARMLEGEEKLSELMGVVRGEKKDGGVEYPFMEGETLSDVLTRAVRQADPETVKAVFGSIRELAAAGSRRAAYGGKDFEEWFGPEKLSVAEALCAQPANIDLIPDNIFTENGKLKVCDCEWVTDFPVPVSFPVWRALEAVYRSHPGLQEVLEKDAAFALCEISPEDADVFPKWSWHFENEYVAPGSETRFGRRVSLLTANLPEVGTAVERMTREIRSRDAHIEQLILSERTLQGTVKSQEAHISQLIESERTLNGTVAQREQRIRELTEELQAVYNSRSWRATEIPRKIHRKLSGIKKRGSK